MKLPANFTFSQSSIQDYLDCPRRFELRYVLKIRWPAPITEPVIEYEHHVEQGLQFHQMVQQFVNNLPLELIFAGATDPDLQTWWNNFIASAPIASYSGKKYPEYRLSIPFEGHRLVAQYDLVLADEKTGSAVIFDWKTSRVHPKKEFMALRAQSIIYPFVLAEAGLPSFMIQPEKIKMIYWYPNFPDKPDIISYDIKRHQHTAAILKDTISNILDTDQGSFLLTTDTRRCQFCNYRSLCSRGEKAGKLDQLEEDVLDIFQSDSLDNFDFNETPEIRF
ncbi:MAG: PD-(D/E)XK nuclease family protein [Anaerolineae bacterium]|nr:PD-(D/E)XK nuclease family protein [Anaerolineae bacterium]